MDSKPKNHIFAHYFYVLMKLLQYGVILFLVANSLQPWLLESGFLPDSVVEYVVDITGESQDSETEDADNQNTTSDDLSESKPHLLKEPKPADLEVSTPNGALVSAVQTSIKPICAKALPIREGQKEAKISDGLIRWTYYSKSEGSQSLVIS